MRGRSDTAANLAARAVLVDGHTQAEAMRLTGATRSTVADAVKRYSEARLEILFSFTDCMNVPRDVQSRGVDTEDATMEIELKVRRHPSGRYTLTEQNSDDKLARDCTGNLFGNQDQGAFYKAVAAKLSNLYQEGFVVKYVDRT